MPAGEVILTLSLEDLHERDTAYFLFQLVYLGGAQLRTSLGPLVDTDAITDAADLLGSLRLDAEFHDSGMALLCADPLPSQPVELLISELVKFGRGGLWDATDRARQFKVQLGPDRTSAALLRRQMHLQGV